MRRLLLAGWMSLVLLSGSSLMAQGSRRPAVLHPRGYDWNELDSRLRGLVPGRVRGLAFVLERRGSILFSLALGDQTTATVLPIASSTKLPSALLLLTLVDEGKLELDRPIREYVGDQIDWPAGKSSITMRMLLNHLSGLPDVPCLDDRTTTLRDCAQQIAKSELRFVPGTKFYYGGSSFQVAGYVAEIVSGKSWNALFNERLATPLALSRLTYTSSMNPRIAGGAFSDVADYVRILQMVRDGGAWNGRRILSPAAIRESESDQIAGIPKAYSPVGASLPGYSYGWWHSDPVLHAGSRGPELSDQGAFGCTPWIDLDLGYTAVLLINDRTSTGTEIWNAIRPLIIAQLTR